MSTALSTFSIDQSRSSSRHAMTTEECIRLLRETGWGVLCVAEHTADAAVPVGVPTAYAYDGERVYLAMADGRKLRALDGNPHLCLTVTDVRSLDHWRSVAVIGRPRWLADDDERARAVAAFTEQLRPRGQRLTSRDAQRLTNARVLTLQIDELRGFASGTVAVGGDDTGLECAAEAMNAVRRIVRALRVAERQSEAERGISAAALFVLREIEKGGAPTIGELARRTATGQSSVSEVVARLSARGLVMRGRSATDRRRAEITLSAAGRDLLRNAPEALQERLLAAFRRMPARRQREVAEGLAEWTSMAGLEGVAPSMFFEPLVDES